MKKLLLLMLSILVAVVLVACGETETQEKSVDTVESSNKSSETNNENADGEETEAEEAAEETEETESATYDEVLLDDENATVILKGIETVRDDVFGDEHNINLEIENKTDATIEVQAHEVSIDGFMVDDMVFFSETVAGGKKSNAKMSIMALDEELPELNENLEFKLMILDEGFMDISSADVSVNVK
ncbi:hypothetical protein [Ornithinibacillus sp. JPR2-1]|uniref:hypothetical protein n=1 Tax=Ornithinibacillus sp. JPR2-1 TaxID=2094019 RepID=UPI0031E17FDC